VSDERDSYIFGESTLRVKAGLSSETMVPVYETALLNILENRNLNTHRRENLKSRTVVVIVIVV
jgi:hypothetical protein